MYLFVSTITAQRPIILEEVEEFPEGEVDEILPLVPAKPINQKVCPVVARPASPSLMVAQYVTDDFPWVMTPQNANEIPLLKVSSDITASMVSSLGPELPRIRGDTFYQQIIRTINIEKLKESGHKKGLTDIYDIKEIENFADSLGIPKSTKKEMITKILERINQLTVK